MGGEVVVRGDRDGEKEGKNRVDKGVPVCLGDGGLSCPLIFEGEREWAIW